MLQGCVPAYQRRKRNSGEAPYRILPFFFSFYDIDFKQSKRDNNIIPFFIFEQEMLALIFAQDAHSTEVNDKLQSKQ